MQFHCKSGGGYLGPEEDDRSVILLWPSLGAFGVLVVRLVYPRDTGSNPKTNTAREGIG